MYRRIVLRSRIPRTTIGSHTQPSLSYYARRTLATTGYSPPPNQPQTPPRPKTGGGDSNALYIGGGLAAIGALWYYFAITEKPTHVTVERQGRTPGHGQEEAQPAIDEVTRVAREGAQVYQDVKGTLSRKPKEHEKRTSSEIESGILNRQLGYRVSGTPQDS